MGTILIWMGAFGYNAGSGIVFIRVLFRYSIICTAIGHSLLFAANAPTGQAVMAIIITNLSGSIGAITWSLLDYVSQRKCSAISFCAGAVSGLIAVTPAAGCVSPLSSVVYAVIGSILCRSCHNFNIKCCMDDSLDVFALHGVSGAVGMILNVMLIIMIV